MNPQLTYDGPLGSGNRLSLTLGTGAVLCAAAALRVPWVVPLAAAAVVLAFSFFENESFLLTVIFLQPIDLVSSIIPVVSDAALGLHGLVFVGFFLGRMFRGQLRFRNAWRQAGTWTSLLFVASIALSAVCGLSGLAHEKIRGVYFIAVYFGFYLFLMSWMVTERRKRAALRMLLYSTILVGIFAIVQVVSGSYTRLYILMYELLTTEWQRRPPSSLPGPNALAGYLNLVLPFAIACYLLTRERGWKWLSGVTVAIGISSLVLTQSRGGYIAFAVTAIFAIWHFGATYKRRISLLLAAALLAAASYAALLQWNPRHFADVGDDLSALSRVILWYTAWNLFLSSPVHGIGFGTFSFVSDQYLPAIDDMPEGLGVHNIYLELLAESGVLGLASFLAVAAGGIRRARIECRAADWFQHACGFGAAGGMAAMLVGGFVDHNVLWAPQIGLSFWLLLALVEGQSAERGSSAIFTERTEPID